LSRSRKKVCSVVYTRVPISTHSFREMPHRASPEIATGGDVFVIASIMLCSFDWVIGFFQAQSLGQS